MSWPATLSYPDRVLQQLRTCLASVKTLRLTIDGSTRFVTFFSGLRQLILSFLQGMDDPRLTSIAETLYVRGLGSIMISHVSCTPSELASLLRRHRASLRRIVLYGINFPGEDDNAWVDLLGMIGRDMMIQYLRLEGCLASRRQVSFSNGSNLSWNAP
ncbi:hypothetical protein GGR52DRAFT_546832 [Hypoxylon sp. FL1284]|nr:hypothetical protein GGR52DRAFT_546832 [Hypoxylon sp. FL1284]